MIRKQVVVAIDRMFERISAGVEAFQPAKADFDTKLPYGPMISTRISFQHLLYMRDRLLASNEKHDFDTPKANRWLGFIQGVLWSHGVFSIGEMGKINGDAMKEVALEEGWLDPAAPSAAETLCDMLNVLVRPKQSGENVHPLASDMIEFEFALPFDGVKRSDTARSPEEAFDFTLWRLSAALWRYQRRNETREQRIERCAEELVQALRDKT